MAITKDAGGHPTDWNMRLVMNGKVFTYCMGCVVERCQLDNLEAYDNPYIKNVKKAKVNKNVDKEPQSIHEDVNE